MTEQCRSSTHITGTDPDRSTGRGLLVMCDSLDSCVVVKRHKAQGSCAWSCARCTAAWEQEHAHSHYPHCRRVEGDPCAGRTDVPRVEPVAHRIMAQQIRSQAYYRIVHDCICEARRPLPTDEDVATSTHAATSTTISLMVSRPLPYPFLASHPSVSSPREVLAARPR